MADRNLVARYDIGQRNIPVPLLGILGPIIGLVYIVVLPFVGLVILILLGLVRARESLPAAWRRALRLIVVA